MNWIWIVKFSRSFSSSKETWISYTTPYTIDSDKSDYQEPNRAEWLTAVRAFGRIWLRPDGKVPLHEAPTNDRTKKETLRATFMAIRFSFGRLLFVAAIISYSSAHSSSFCRSRFTRFAILSLFCALQTGLVLLIEDSTRLKPVILTNRRESRDSDASALIHSTAT